MDFDFTNEEIHCQSTIGTLTAQQLYDACKEMEDNAYAMGYDGIADGEGKATLTDSATALTVTLLGWKLYSEKTSGEFIVKDGNVIFKDDATQLTNTAIFKANPLVQYTNQLEANGVIVSIGSGLSTSQATTLSNIEVIAAALQKIALNRTVLSEGDSGNFIVYDDDNVTPLYTHSVKDKDGGAVILDDGVPAERGKAS